MTRNKRLIATLAATVAGLTLAATSQTAFAATTPSPQLRAAGDPGVVTLRLASDASQVANVSGASTQDGAPVIQYPYSSTAANELWRVERTDDGYLLFISVNSNKCLNVRGGGNAAATPVIQYTCSHGSTPNERWRLVQVGNGYQIVAQSSGQCLNVRGGVGVGSPLIQYPCTPGGAPNDVWLPVWEPANQ
jgi:Ricin-type beta-trefoil lectin domain